MARKARDYKAEYRAAKLRATRAGYKSEREYKRVRRELALPPRTMPVPKRILETNPIVARRRESQRWSDAHSHKDTSRYSPSLTDRQAELYHAAYVAPYGKRMSDAKRLDLIHDYLVPDWMSQDEWDASPYLLRV